MNTLNLCADLVNGVYEIETGDVEFAIDCGNTVLYNEDFLEVLSYKIESEDIPVFGVITDEGIKNTISEVYGITR